MSRLAAASQQTAAVCRPYAAQFAELLDAIRDQADLTVRQLATSTTYSHSAVVRATTGDRLPSWRLTSAYLEACGIGGDDLKLWKHLWNAARIKDREIGRSGLSPACSPAADAEWQGAVSAVRQIDPLLVQLRMAASLRDFSVALVRLSRRHGADSLRKLEAKTGIPRATLHGWYTGKRRPSEARLNELVVRLEATPTEQHEFAACLERVTMLGCGSVHPSTRRPCVLGKRHNGTHGSSDGRQWLDNDEGEAAPKRFTAAEEEERQKWLAKLPELQEQQMQRYKDYYAHRTKVRKEHW